MKKKHNTNWRRRGIALVAVLWVAVLLTSIVMVMAKSIKLDSYITQSSAQQVRGRWAMRAGVEKALALLNEDTKSSDCLSELWSDSDEDCNDILLEGCTLSFKIIDEASKLNINTMTTEQLQRLRYMTKDVTDAIIDWRDQDNNPQTEGAEMGYYLNLNYGGYDIRNGPFRTLRELLLVKGVTDDLFYGEDTNFNGRLDANEKDGDKTWPYDNQDDVLDKGWADYLTCYSYDQNVDAMEQERININEADEDELQNSLQLAQGYAKWIVENRGNDGFENIGDLLTNNSKENKQQGAEESDQAEPLDKETFAEIADSITTRGDGQVQGRINVNTASEEVLTILLEGNRTAASGIINYRKQLLYGMESIGELLKVPGIDVETFKTIADQVTTRSNVFSIQCTVKSNVVNAEYKKIAVVDRSGDAGTILYWYEGADH